MKMKIIILSSFVIFTISLKSQNSFEFILQDTLSSKCFSTFVDNDGYFISIGSSGTPSINEYNALIVKFKNQSNITVNKFYKVDTSSFFKFGFLMQNGNYFIAGKIEDNNFHRDNLYVLELSPELEIIKENIYGIPEYYDKISLHNLYLDSDSIVIVNGWVDDPATGNLKHLYVAKLNMQGELLNTLINTQFKADFHSEIVGKSDDSGYYFIGDFGFARLIEIDNDLNIIGYQPMDPSNLYYGAIGARWISEENLVIGSLANQDIPGAFYDLHMRICSVDLEPIIDTVIFDDGFNWLPAYSGLDLIDENYIWVATYPQLGKSITDWEYGRIYIFDSNLNVKGAKYFGGISSLYLYSLKALDDGGCIITGIAADELNKGYTDVYIKKVMPDDILTNSEETPVENDMDVLLYPIPFKNELNIETYRKGLSLSLYSIDGKPSLLYYQLEIPFTKINTSHLKKGYLNYVIYDNGRIIQSGKLIKHN